MIPLVAVSGPECVVALELAGFRPSASSGLSAEGGTTLERGGRIVVVPDVAMLKPEELQKVLDDAGIAYDGFLDLLSEAPTDPDILRRRARPRVGQG